MKVGVLLADIIHLKIVAMLSNSKPPMRSLLGLSTEILYTIVAQGAAKLPVSKFEVQKKWCVQAPFFQFLFQTSNLKGCVTFVIVNQF